MQAAKQKAKGKLPQLQIIRALASIVIFASHAFPKYGSLGGLGVSVFFVLSGFVMTYSSYNRDLSVRSVPDAIRFSLRRIRKLYILHAVLVGYIVFRTACVSWAGRGSIDLPVKTILLNLLLLKVWVPNEAVYFSMKGVSWYLCDIFYIFLFFPLILHWIRGRSLSSLLRAAGAFCLAALAAALFVYRLELAGTVSAGFTKWFTYVMPLFRLNDFFVGCCAGTVFLTHLQDREVSEGRGLYTVLELMTCLLIVLLYRLRINNVLFFNKPWLCSTLIWLPTSVFLVSLFARKRGLFSSFLTKSRVLILIGDLSGYAFLIHPFFISFVNSHTSAVGGRRAAFMLAAFILTQCAAWLWMKMETLCTRFFRASEKKG